MCLQVQVSKEVERYVYNCNIAMSSSVSSCISWQDSESNQNRHQNTQAAGFSLLIDQYKASQICSSSALDDGAVCHARFYLAIRFEKLQRLLQGKFAPLWGRECNEFASKTCMMSPDHPPLLRAANYKVLNHRCVILLPDFIPVLLTGSSVNEGICR